jgi:hypothetical protein
LARSELVTEAEWLACHAPELMLRYLGRNGGAEILLDGLAEPVVAEEAGDLEGLF